MTADTHDTQSTAQATAEAIETNPLGVLVGGLAVGALVGAIIPRSTRERQLLAPVGRRLALAGAAALAAAREAGQAELESLGLTKDAARDQAKNVFQGALKAAGTAGKAAAQAGSEQVRAAQ
jgi:hypothetical protein